MDIASLVVLLLCKMWAKEKCELTFTFCYVVVYYKQTLMQEAIITLYRIKYKQHNYITEQIIFPVNCSYFRLSFATFITVSLTALPHRARIRSDNFPYYEGIIANKWLEIIVYHRKLNSVTTKLGLITLCISHLSTQSYALVWCSRGCN